MNPKGFRITDGKGFQVTFPNGYTVSVQFGPANYGDHYDCSPLNLFEGRDQYDHPGPCGNDGAYKAEVAVIYKGNLLALPEFEGDTVGGYYDATMVLALMNWAAMQEDDRG